MSPSCSCFSSPSCLFVPALAPPSLWFWPRRMAERRASGPPRGPQPGAKRAAAPRRRPRRGPAAAPPRRGRRGAGGAAADAAAGTGRLSGSKGNGGGEDQGRPPLHGV
eukprot:scaffold12808_cov79-Phaeocystis_antarctica.AAC.2